MAQSEFELISNFFTESGLKYLYRDLESERGNQSIEAMNNALDVLNINNHDEIILNLMDIYENLINYFAKVDTIKYPDITTYNRCVEYHNRLHRRFSSGRTRGLFSLFNKCKLVSGPLEINRYQFTGDNLKIFDMLYNIVRVNIAELIKKNVEFEDAYGDYLDSIYNSDDESRINECIDKLVVKGKSICGPLINEIKRAYEILYRETNLSDDDDDDDFLSISDSTSSDSSDTSQASTLPLDISDTGVDVSDLEERLEMLPDSTGTEVRASPVDSEEEAALIARLDALRGGSKNKRKKKTKRKTKKKSKRKKTKRRSYKK